MRGAAWPCANSVRGLRGSEIIGECDYLHGFIFVACVCVMR